MLRPLFPQTSIRFGRENQPGDWEGRDPKRNAARPSPAPRQRRKAERPLSPPELRAKWVRLRNQDGPRARPGPSAPKRLPSRPGSDRKRSAWRWLLRTRRATPSDSARDESLLQFPLPARTPSRFQHSAPPPGSSAKNCIEGIPGMVGGLGAEWVGRPSGWKGSFPSSVRITGIKYFAASASRPGQLALGATIQHFQVIASARMAGNPWSAAAQFEDIVWRAPGRRRRFLLSPPLLLSRLSQRPDPPGGSLPNDEEIDSLRIERELLRPGAADCRILSSSRSRNGSDPRRVKSFRVCAR